MSNTEIITVVKVNAINYMYVYRKCVVFVWNV